MAKRIDQKDIDILNVLQANCRTKLRHLAAHAGLTKSPVYDRIVMLERDGYIRRYGAVINKDKFGLHYRAFVRVQLLPGSAQGFEAMAADFHEVECAYQLSDDSFLLLVAVQDVRAYSRFITGRLQETGLVSDHQTWILKKELKAFAHLPGLGHIKETSKRSPEEANSFCSYNS